MRSAVPEVEESRQGKRRPPGARSAGCQPLALRETRADASGTRAADIAANATQRGFHLVFQIQLPLLELHFFELFGF